MGWGSRRGGGSESVAPCELAGPRIIGSDQDFPKWRRNLIVPLGDVPNRVAMIGFKCFVASVSSRTFAGFDLDDFRRFDDSVNISVGVVDRESVGCALSPCGSPG